MSNFTPLTKEEKEIRDSIVIARIKQELEFFNVPSGTVEKLDKIMEELQPYLKSDSKIEVAIAADIYARVSGIRFILNLLKNGN